MGQSIDVYYWPTPNGWKVTILLEELDVAYAVKPINIGKGDQFEPDFPKIAPNNRMPAIVDHEPMGGGERQGQTIGDFPHLLRWFEAIEARPAVRRGRDIGKEWRRVGDMGEEEKKVPFRQTAQAAG